MFRKKKVCKDSPVHVCRCTARLQALGIVLDKHGNEHIKPSSVNNKQNGNKDSKLLPGQDFVLLNNPTCKRQYAHPNSKSHSHKRCYWNTAYDSFEKHEFTMEMTCEGCSNAAKRVLAKIGVNEVEPDLDKQKVYVVSDKSSDELLEVLKKTGKRVEYVGVV